MAITTADDFLHADVRGTIRIRDTGVRLERILTAHAMGEMPADMVDMFDVELADVERILDLYRAAPSEFDEYLRKHEEAGERMRAFSEANGMSGRAKLEEIYRQAGRKIPSHEMNGESHSKQK